MVNTRTSVYALIIADGHVLLVNKTIGPYRGLLDLPGGGQEKGESLEQALKREVVEETGLELAAAAPYADRSFEVRYRNELGILEDLRIEAHFYLAIVSEKQEPTTWSSQDTSGAGWYPIEIDPKLLTPIAAFALLTAEPEE